MNNIHTLIIPDVHGRTFWKEAIEKFPKDKFPELTIIFLGDYVDPYTFEGITREAAIDNFQEIIDIAKNDNRIHLLIGNHDMHYWYDAEYKSRVDTKNYNKIKEMFLENFSLFNIAYEETINNEKYLYTHAGVSKPWLDHLRFIGDLSLKTNIGKLSNDQIPFCEMLRDMTPDADKLNKMKDNFQGQANLWMASYARGGDYNCGSCIWEDLGEWMYEGMEIPGIWQIFGHSRWSKSDPDDAFIDKKRKFACVDTASAWVITNKGKLKKLFKTVKDS
jgi:predicted phosphodiesterase